MTTRKMPPEVRAAIEANLSANRAVLSVPKLKGSGRAQEFMNATIPATVTIDDKNVPLTKVQSIKSAFDEIRAAFRELLTEKFKGGGNRHNWTDFSAGRYGRTWSEHAPNDPISHARKISAVHPAVA